MYPKYPPHSVLTISYVGYVTQEIPVDGRSVIDVTLKESREMLDEVVVVGYGTVKKRDLTGAVASVKSGDLTMTPVASATEALEGRVAGLDITRESGQAGSGTKILLRGNRSLTAGQDPLFVIDGIPGSIDNLNPNDIQSIDILKDASSTAIYGSAGANGVIMITTKQAEEGKVQVDLDTYFGWNGFAKYPKALSGDAWLDYLKEGYYATTGNQASDLTQLFNGYGYNADVIRPYVEQGKWIDWVDETLQTGTQQNYSVSIRGGNERFKGNFSLGYNRTEGIYRDDKSDLYTSRFGMDLKINKWLTAGMQGGLTFRDVDNRSTRLNRTFSYVPVGDVYDAEGNINIYPVDGLQDQVSLLADEREGVYKKNSKTFAFTANPYLDVTILPEMLTFRTILGTSVSSSRTGEFKSNDTFMMLTGSETAIRKASLDPTLSYNYTWENILNFRKSWNNTHNLGLTLITSWAYNQKEKHTAYNEGFLYDKFLWYSLSSGTNPSVSSSYTQTKRMSYATRVNYDYLGRYLFTASVRQDGVSQLYNHWDTFPAAALAWRISDEPFMESTRNWLNNLKLRVGYGVSGNPNVDAYVSRTEVTSNGLDNINFGSGPITSSVLSQAVGNVEMGWEKSYNWNIGVDFGIINNRIDGALEFYDTDTKDVLYSRNLPSTGGLFKPKNPYKMVCNVARMRNTGFEMTINSRNIVTKDFQWTTTLTFAANKERVKSIDLGSGTTVDNLVSLGLFMDNPKDMIYNYRKLGIWQKGEEADAAVFGLLPGDSKVNTRLVKVSDGLWTLTEEDGTVTEYTAENPYQIGEKDKELIGHKSPSWTAGLNNSFYYKGFDLNVFITARWGQTVQSPILGYFGRVAMPDFYDYWTESNPTNDFPRPYMSRSTSHSASNLGLGIVDGSYWKIKTISLGYTLPKNVLDKAGMSRCRFYGTISNPFVFAKDKLLRDVDPETGGTDGFPLYKQIVFGINLSF
ncbi:TonB-dependent receptor [Duncaniella freteri]|uniref:SusC/RagA family TonB-linked outer membrane protein n=1 Tax=Duncaniella freteri TaxID=2530391 RepID=UPI00338DF025